MNMNPLVLKGDNIYFSHNTEQDLFNESDYNMKYSNFKLYFHI